jgi:hypothetical protein
MIELSPSPDTPEKTKRQGTVGMRGVWGAGLAGLLCLATASLLLVRDSRTWGVASVTELVGSDHDQFFSISRELASIRQSKLGRGLGTAPSMGPSPPSRDEPTVREADAVAPQASLASLDRVAPPARQPESEREIETSIRATRGRKPAIISPRSPHGRARRAVKLLRAMRKEIGARVAGRSKSNAALRRELQKAMTLLRSKRGGRGRAELAHASKRRVQKLGIVDDVTDALGFGPPPGEVRTARRGRFIASEVHRAFSRIVSATGQAPSARGIGGLDPHDVRVARACTPPWIKTF